MAHHLKIITGTAIALLVIVAGLWWLITPSVSFYGKALDLAGHPVAGAKVHVVAYPIPLFELKQTGREASGHQTSYDFITDADGAFKMRGRYRDVLVCQITLGELNFDVVDQKYEFTGDQVTDTSSWSPAIFYLKKGKPSWQVASKANATTNASLQPAAR